MVHLNRIFPFKHPKDMSKENIETLAETDLYQFYVENSFVDQTNSLSGQSTWVVKNDDSNAKTR